MLPSPVSFRRKVAMAALVTVLFLVGIPVHAEQPGSSTSHAGPIVVEGLGRGTFKLDGPWLFHPGDDAAWADPAYDSSTWEQLTAKEPWGVQGHEGLTGFAWYRCRIAVTPAPGVPAEFSLLVPRIRDAYEVYWNGTLIGRNGKLAPRPVRILSQPAQIFELGPVREGVLAVRVWKAPLLSDDSSAAGGFGAAPSIGGPEAIAAAQAATEFQWLRSRQFLFGENLLCGVIAFLCLLLWARVPSRWVLFWTAAFTMCSPAIVLLLNAHLGLPYAVAMGLGQPVATLQDVSLWFLLLWLLSLREHRGLYRLTCILAGVYLANSVVDGILVALNWDPQWTRFAQIGDVVSTLISVPMGAFPLVLVGYALFERKRFNPARWLVAILAFLDEMMLVFMNVVKQGRQFTAWPIAEKIDAPLFSVAGNGISLSALAGILLLVAIVYAVYNSVREDQRRRDALEREKTELINESNRMRHQAEHDGLTGLWNHRAIVERLGAEMNRSLREGAPLSVVLIDVDHFKKVNDTFGHLVGDLVLKELSAIFTRSMRAYDCVGRYGGEEFLLILPNCEMKAALARAEQLRAAVESARIVDRETVLQVTASFGVASAAESLETETVIRTVDAALYQAKSNGRNCIAQAEVEAPVCEH
jgi:diguanylate cyclase